MLFNAYHFTFARVLAERGQQRAFWDFGVPVISSKPVKLRTSNLENGLGQVSAILATMC